MSSGEKISDQHNRENAARVAKILNLKLTPSQVDEFALLRSDLTCGKSDEAIMTTILAKAGVDGYSAALSFYAATVPDVPHFLAVITPVQA